MIPEVIHRDRDAARTTRADVRRLIYYVCGKAVRTVTCNLLGDWRDADWQMWAIAGGNRSHTTLTYHVCLSWVEDERPTPDQMIASALRVLAALGLQDHQAVIGIHKDRHHWHVHLAVNRVHPQTFAVFHTTHDYARLEKACRDIEMSYGWPADRGRFNPVIIETADGPVLELHPPTAAQRHAKQQRRKTFGIPTQSDLNYTRRTGMAPLIQSLSDAWKMRIGSVLTGAPTWTALHAGLRDLNLTYSRTTSGARLTLRGSDAFLIPSQLGPEFGLKLLTKRLGPWRDAPLGGNPTNPVDPHTLTNRLRCADDDVISRHPPSRAPTFAIRAKVYADITADQRMADRIARIDLDRDMPCVTLTTGDIVMDPGDTIVTGSVQIDGTHARITLAMAAAKGWASMAVSGAARFVQAVLDMRDHVGLTLKAMPKEQIDAREVDETPVLVPRQASAAQQMQAQADKVKQKAVARRKADRIRRADLAHAQKDNRDRLHALIGSGRGLHAQAMRAGLALHHAEQRADLRQRLMMVGMMMTPILPAKAPPSPVPPNTKRRHAARQVLAALMPDGTPSGWNGGADLDHTACRQLWAAADSPTLAHFGIDDRSGTPEMPPDYRRIEKDGHTLFLFAHRDENASIVGFAFSTFGIDDRMETGIAIGGHQTVHVLNGQRIRRRVVVVASGMDALVWSHREGRSDTTYISTHGAFGHRTVAALAQMLEGRTVIAAFDATPEGDALFASLRHIVPAIRWKDFDTDRGMTPQNDASTNGPDVFVMSGDTQPKPQPDAASDADDSSSDDKLLQDDDLSGPSGP